MKSRLFLAAATLAFASPAYAESPEQLDQLEPGKGEWQVEYAGQFGSTDNQERPHEFEAFCGVSDRVAIGFAVETEAEDGDLGFGEAGLSATGS